MKKKIHLNKIVMNLGKEYNTSVFYSIEKLLDSNIECDVIAICTPNGLHAKHSIMSLYLFS